MPGEPSQGLSYGRSIGGTARYLNVDRDNAARRSDYAVGSGEDAAVDGAVPAGDDHPRPGDRFQSLEEGTSHVLGDHTGDEEAIGMSGRGDQAYSKASDVAHWAQRLGDLNLAAVA